MICPGQKESGVQGMGDLWVMDSEPGGLLSIPGGCVCQGRSLRSFTARSGSPRRPLDCDVFRGGDKLVICPGRRHRPEGVGPSTESLLKF